MAKYLFLILVILPLTLISCKHDPDPSHCQAGTGGFITIVAYARHGTTFLPNHSTHKDTAFVKFGTLISPGTSTVNYDTFYVGEPGEDHIHCSGLKCGEYFVFRTAWDSVENVRRYGGHGISIADTSGEKLLILDVN